MKKLLFHHLPKTAGSSLIVQCQKFFDSSCNNARYDPELTLKKINSPKYQFYHGHFSFDKVREFRVHNPNSLVFTFLRNPVNRVISHYFNKIDETKVLPEIERVRKRGIIKELNEKKESYSKQIFKMSLGDFLVSSNKIAKESRFNRMSRYLCPQNLFKSNRELAAVAATENMSTFYNVFGLTELMEDSLRLIEKRINIPNKYLDDKFQTNLNTQKSSGKRYKVSLSNLKRLIEYNLYDIELYAYCYSSLNKELKLDRPDELSDIEILLETGPEIDDVASQDLDRVKLELEGFYFSLKLAESRKYLRKHINQFLPSEDISKEKMKTIVDNLRKKDQFTKSLVKRRNHYLQKCQKWTE